MSRPRSVDPRPGADPAALDPARPEPAPRPASDGPSRLPPPERRSVRLRTEVPGPRSLALLERRDAAVARGAARLTRVAVERAKGAVVTDADGNDLLDFAGGIGALALGHNRAEVVEAIRRQAEALVHPCAIVATAEPYVLLAERLAEVAPIDGPRKAVLLNSGAEAVETAVKIARAATGRSAIVVFEGGYHGRTNLTLAMTSKYALFKKGFGPFASDVVRLPFPHPWRRPDGLDEDAWLDWCLRELDHAFVAQIDPAAVAAVVVEPVQGEGGFVPAPPRWLRRLRELCDRHGMLFVADEVQSGMGRTGRLWAVEHAGVRPDLLVTAKSLGGGMPIAAVVGRAGAMDAPHPGGLGGTYSGNPVACAAALAALDLIADEAFLARARELGERLREGLEAIATASGGRAGAPEGLGPMLAIPLRRADGAPDPEGVARVCERALERGLIVIRAGLHSDRLRLLPPLDLSDDQADEGLAILADAVRAALEEGAAVPGPEPEREGGRGRA